ncbi:hypothetical protein HNR20_004749 [Micromonospora parathelypteridis]|uniref:Uncharacterized protein n=1 Tax=Micromonospora parathelypteridis TaxID=1839617 RepID=A0A840W2G1_9ACTN|nr:hypothetical protein [Micromonospora parathelypteridis]
MVESVEAAFHDALMRRIEGASFGDLLARWYPGWLVLG